MSGQLQMEFSRLGHRSTSLTKKCSPASVHLVQKMLMGLDSKPIPTSFC